LPGPRHTLAHAQRGPCFFATAKLNHGVAPPLAIDVSTARRFHRRALGLDAPFPDVGAALAHLGYVQIDPINVCGRMHDLILRHRVSGYREGDLARHLHGHEGPLPAVQRTAFEHHLPDSAVLAAFPVDAWPHLLAAMRLRSRRTGAWSGRLTPRERVLATEILAALAARGPLGAEDFEDDRRSRRVWGAARLVKSTLQKLFFHGRVLIAQRANNRRRYDLPERVLSAAVLRRPEPSPAETARWLATLKLRQRRLTTLKRDELRVVDDLVQPVTVPGCPPLFCLRDDVGLFDTVARETPGSATVRLLAPLDPLIYDRRTTAALWDFEYTWEAYTPAHKRRRGHYALPVLAGTELVGHVDPKADRVNRRLIVVSRRVPRGYSTAAALGELAGWLGLRR
jgi:uncharacterized protein YcaQ